MTTADFATWLADLALAAGYDTTPHRGGRRALAMDMGVDPSVVGKMLGGFTPAIETQRRLVEVLNSKNVKVTVREMLIRSGTLREEDLPLPDEQAPPPIAEIDLYAVARRYGIPDERAELFVASARALAKTFADEPDEATIKQPSQTGRLSAKR
ncbi:helix-turn-helix domain-containing protein [Kitasatospora sp. NPDC001175]|uniref:helix-turn-helix domain-containing protein n=1 Tax=Kitasatospora sp. NPDC001175 TaxID=3157103 RepID=UPI003D03C57C